MSGSDLIHLHSWSQAISRREFLGATAGTVGTMATSGLWFPTLALADDVAGSSPDVLPMTPRPVVIPGGDVFTPSPPPSPQFPPFQIHQFLPGDPAVLPGADGIDAEPNGITNFRGLVAMGYTTGTATDDRGRQYTATTDNRVYHGEYVAVDGRHARGTFVEI